MGLDAKGDVGDVKRLQNSVKVPLKLESKNIADDQFSFGLRSLIFHRGPSHRAGHYNAAGWASLFLQLYPLHFITDCCCAVRVPHSDDFIFYDDGEKPQRISAGHALGTDSNAQQNARGVCVAIFERL